MVLPLQLGKDKHTPLGLRSRVCKLDNDVCGVHLNWTVRDEQEFVRWKGTGTRYQRDHLKCEHHRPFKEQGSCDVATTQGGAGREGAGVGRRRWGATGGYHNCGRLSSCLAVAATSGCYY